MNFIMDIAMMIRESLVDWPLGTVAGSLLILALLLLAGLIVWGLFVAVDSWFLPRSRGMGKVRSKEFTPAHTDMILIYNAATKTSMPHPMYYPDNWSVCVEVSGRQDSISVDQEEFNILKEGDSVITEYVSGRISNSLYIKNIVHA